MRSQTLPTFQICTDLSLLVPTAGVAHFRRKNKNSAFPSTFHIGIFSSYPSEFHAWYNIFLRHLDTTRVLIEALRERKEILLPYCCMNCSRSWCQTNEWEGSRRKWELQNYELDSSAYVSKENGTQSGLKMAWVFILRQLPLLGNHCSTFSILMFQYHFLISVFLSIKQKYSWSTLSNCSKKQIFILMLLWRINMQGEDKGNVIWTSAT